jgi:lysyl-tRNA synthetase class II
VPDDEDRSAVEQARRVKLARLRAAGIDVYPVGFRRTHTLEEVRRGWDHQLKDGEESDDVVRVARAASPSGPCATTAMSSR